MDFNVKPIESKENKAKLIYLASPYSHDNPHVVERRFQHICYIAGNMIEAGLLIYCPIAHSHPIAQQGVANTWGTWQSLDLEMLSRCDALWVAKMAGWQHSTGVHAEINEAKRLNIPVHFVPDKYLVF